MNEKVQTIIAETKEKFGLEQYTLANHSIFRESNMVKGLSYLLSMEWLPSRQEQTNEDLLPAGSLTIEVDLHTNLLKRFIVVGDTVKITKALPTSTQTEDRIEWIEEETELAYGRQFKLTTEEKDELIFHAAVDNIPVWPVGSIHIKFNTNDQMTLFAIDGYFPSEDEIQWEPFALTSDITGQTGKEHCELVEVPVDELEKWISIYHIPTHFITNDGSEIFPIQDAESPAGKIDLDQPITWSEAIDKRFEKKEIDLSSEVSAEQALNNEVHPDQPLTNDEMNQATDATKTFMQMEFPDDSGKWKITALWPEHGLIFAELHPVQPDRRLISRKIKLMIDRDTFDAMNYINNDTLLEQINHFQQADDSAITKDTAFQELKPYLEVIPIYVYFREKNAFYLCGKVDCAYGVNASSGEVILLKES